MRPRMILIALAAVVAAVAGVALVARGDRDDTSPARASGLEAKTVIAGDITVQLEPHHIDATGAEFRVALDTHSEELEMDLVAGARLVVDGTDWPAIAWNGDGPSGHHRQGRLRFDAAGAATGPVELSLRGFAAPVAAQWSLGR